LGIVKKITRGRRGGERKAGGALPSAQKTSGVFFEKSKTAAARPEKNICYSFGGKLGGKKGLPPAPCLIGGRQGRLRVFKKRPCRRRPQGRFLGILAEGRRDAGFFLETGKSQSFARNRKTKEGFRLKTEVRPIKTKNWLLSSESDSIAKRYSPQKRLPANAPR
jgi:hypothetical protein